MRPKLLLTIALLGWLLCVSGPMLDRHNPSAEVATDYSLIPPFVTAGAPPLVMLVLGRDHKLYFEAYNDASDLDGDGALDVGYKPAIDYYGYFDSHKCYNYSSSNARFEPSATTTNKKCSGRYAWSGDFLNYLTMSRMDCLRKVLYGGYRSTDTATETVLRRAFIPQDAHTWGKEYASIARDGYDIREYTPLSLPATGTYHLFASTTLSNTGDPLLRVLQDRGPIGEAQRIWHWVSKERPVADSSLVATGTDYTSYPADHQAYEDLVLQYATFSHEQGSGIPANGRIDGGGNPYGASDYYLTIFTGSIQINTAGNYELAVDGDDAVEVIIDGTVVAGWYGAHSKCTCQTHKGTIFLSAGSHNVEFRQQEKDGVDYYHLWWKGPDSGNIWQIVPSLAYRDLWQTTYDVKAGKATLTDYVVKVLVGLSSMPESNCKRYPSGVYKPIGILQKHGESDRMRFGLVTGSYAKNTSGGVLRKNIGSIADEINSSTGQFTTLNGIINTFNKLKFVGFNYTNWTHDTNCGWIYSGPITEGQCRMWGNPIAEVMYETLRYFSGALTPTSDFTYSGTTDDSTLGLPLPAWQDPYAPNTGHPYCSKPFMLVISDINPSSDTDQLPGSYFGSFGGSLGALNVQSLADTITSHEQAAGSHYIGQSGTNFDTSCSPKNVTSLGNIRGLCPEEPTKQGGYYAGSVAYHGRKEDIHAGAEDEQNVVTYAVALASPLPKIEIPVAGKKITLVPFAKSIESSIGGGITPERGDFQPTCSIVDFYVESLTPTEGTFRVNFEHAEQGADYDMDSIVKYQYTVNANNTVSIQSQTLATAGSTKQHLGYIISGTTADGVYLEVRSVAHTDAEDPDFYLDTPPGITPNQGPSDIRWDDNSALPINTTRTFTPGSNPPATLLENPLWYAAKWGGYEDLNDNHLPDQDIEWDKDRNGVPDTYFHVVNPLRLEEQLNKSFADIMRRTSSGTAASVISSSRSGKGAIYQAIFYPEYKGTLGTSVNWAGEVHALQVDAYGNMREDTNGNHQLDIADDYFIEFSSDFIGTVFKYQDSNTNGKLDAGERSLPVAVGTMKDLAYLWSTTAWLNAISDSDIGLQRTYASAERKRHVFTFLDHDRNMLPGTGEVVPFTDSETAIYPYLYVYPPFGASAPAYIEPVRLNYPTTFAEFVTRQSRKVINYIRGQDQAEEVVTGTPSYTIPAFRSRQVDFTTDGVLETWRMGDAVHSTPTIVETPAEDLDLLYLDRSYTRFYRKYRKRRHVVYLGANDGMLHAFNAGFYDTVHNKFWKGYDPVANSYSDTGLDLGAELWAYVPYNLLPHLYWLTERTYNRDVHISYVDLKPRVFDAKIFPVDTAHPDGWGTVLVGGMRFGGGKIRADMNKADGMSYDPNTDRTMTSAYFILDITDPESPPTLLGEITSDTLGFTTCYPAVVVLKDKDPTSTENQWYLVLGSGPISANGADSLALANATSSQPAQIVMVDLTKLATDHQIWSLDSSGSLAAGINPFAALDANAFVSDPVAVDYDLDYKTDAVYFGTVSGDFASGLGGKLRRLVVDNDTDPHNWTGNSTEDNTGTLIDLTGVPSGQPIVAVGQPIVAAPSVGQDKYGNRWVFFGTGRFFNRQDATHARAADPQSYYGIKEPFSIDSDGHKVFSYASVNALNLLNVTAATVYQTGTTVQGVTGSTNFNALKSAVGTKDGWYIDFDVYQDVVGGVTVREAERNLGQAALLGDILTFTTYTPSVNPCEFEGISYLYALYFGTGTAYTKSVIGLGSNKVTAGGVDRYEVLKKKSLGRGLTITPNIHTGKEEGSVVYVQTSTGAIVQQTQANPGQTTSGKISWKEEGD